MSSTESTSSEPNAPGQSPEPSDHPWIMVAVTLSLLAALAWALTPVRPDLKPAPLKPPPQGCPKIKRDFLPSNVTEILHPSLAGLTPAQKNRALYRMNMEACTCGCSLSIAACRVNNPDCEVSKDLAEKVIAEVRAASERQER